MSLRVDIQKRLGDFRLNVQFETQGGVLGLLGASGCGKSMTLKCIAGVERPDRGTIVLDGETLFDSERGIDLPPQKRRVGYLFQSYALFPNMTVRQNILCGLRRERDRAKREAELEKALRLCRLEGLEDYRPHQLSGGQQQRTALARILVSDPRVLLLDEPFSALDSHLREKLQLELRELLGRFGRDAVMVTHSRDEAYHMCSRIAVMEAGRLLSVKDAKALFADPGSVAACLLTGCKNIAPARKAGAHEVEVPDWGVRLRTARPVRDDVKAVGVRAHQFRPDGQENRFPVEYLGEMEEPFGWIQEFRFQGQRAGTPPLWRRMPKELWDGRAAAELGVDPNHVLLLYE